MNMSLQKIRVVVWCPLVNPGGGIRLLLQLVHALARQPDIGLIRLVAPRGAIDEQVVDRHNYPTLELWELDVPETRHRFWAWLAREGRVLGIKGTGRLKRVLRHWLWDERADPQLKLLQSASHDCDLIYVFWPHRQAFPTTGLPVVCTFQDAIFFDFPEILGGSETKAEWQRADIWLRNSAQVVVSSQATRAALIRHFGKHCASVNVILHAILPWVSIEEPCDGASLSSRLPSRYIVCPANIMSHKNHYTLLVAWSRFAQRKQFPLVLLGSGTQLLKRQKPDWPDGWQPCRLVGVINRSGLVHGEDFFALGYVEDAEVLDVIRRAVALIMPTLAEGGGSFPVEEALSLGVPVLCSDIPVLREQLIERSAKISWFDPESPDSIVQAVERLLTNYEEYKQAALKAATDFRPSWDDIAAQYVQVFRTALYGKRLS